MPTVTSTGAVGMVPGAIFFCKSSGGMPSRMQSWMMYCRRLISSSGMVASVCSSVLLAWAKSSFVTVLPAR